MASGVPSVWSHEGIILGTPVGSEEFVLRLCDIAKEEPLWQAKWLANPFSMCQPEVRPLLEEIAVLQTEVANKVTVQFTDGQNLDGCLQELVVASEQLETYNVEFAQPLQFQWSQESVNTAGVLTERTLARGEVGATVRRDVKFRDMNIS